jgi:hypothetical protein
MKVFIPVSEEELERCAPTERLVPYRPGLWLLSQCQEKSGGAGDDINRYEAPIHRRGERPVRPPCPR